MFYAAGGLRKDRGPAVANGGLNPQVLDRAPLVAETFIRYGLWLEFRFNVSFLICLRPKAIAAKNTCSWRLSLLRAGEGFTDGWL